MKNKIIRETRKFLSTPSARRATLTALGYDRSRIISIHALREEGDSSRSWGASSTTYFYPRPPRGGRLELSMSTMHTQLFLSTPSARRATPG